MYVRSKTGVVPLPRQIDVEYVPAPLGSVRPHIRRRTLGAGRRSSDCATECPLHTASFKPADPSVRLTGECRKSCCVSEHKYVYITVKDGENLIARHISVDICRLITICWRLSVAVAFAWRIRSIYSRLRALWHKHEQDKHKIIAKNGKSKGLMNNVTECLRLWELMAEILNDTRQVGR
jgi:hypothetical protein